MHISFVWNIPVVFVGILGVIGVFEDIALFRSQEHWALTQIYGKYLSATLGTAGFVLAQLIRQKRQGRDHAATSK